MKTGVIIFPTEYTISMTELGRALEERGFDSLLVPEHTHIPTSRRTPWPGGKPLPKEYSHSLDPFVALSFAAAATKTLTIGTGICLIPQREPLATAKAVASLDLLSGGRMMFGMGAGWNQDEMENHGTVYETRFKLLEDRVRAMKALWTEEEADYHGDFVDFDPVWSYPKPVQSPHPPIFLGGESVHTLRRVVDFCDGWLPRARHGFDAVEEIARLREVADAAGRDMGSIRVSVFGAKPDAGIFANYAEAGIDSALIVVPSDPRDDVLRRLDGYADLIT
jgi:probable F420-dependent oxidoreductase